MGRWGDGEQGDRVGGGGVWMARYRYGDGDGGGGQVGDGGELSSPPVYSGYTRAGSGRANKDDANKTDASSPGGETTSESEKPLQSSWGLSWGPTWHQQHQMSHNGLAPAVTGTYLCDSRTRQ